MDNNEYDIIVITRVQFRTVHIENVTLDEAVSTAIIFFDKFSTVPGDTVLLALTCFNSAKLTTSKTVRKITLKEGLKIEITIPETYEV